MHIPTFGQVATIGMAFFAVAALAVPIAEPLEADLIENDDKKNDGKGNNGGYYRREVATEFDLE
ncbi:hypothetical protein ColTof4_13722 [Colletotrichum tofieldiae]|nr:hypothetical protein ColTof4_13722 [Colletotrichum tofieldiae]